MCWCKQNWEKTTELTLNRLFKTVGLTHEGIFRHILPPPHELTDVISSPRVCVNPYNYIKRLVNRCTYPIVGLMLWSKWSWTNRHTILDFPTPVSCDNEKNKSCEISNIWSMFKCLLLFDTWLQTILSWKLDFMFFSAICHFQVWSMHTVRCMEYKFQYV